MSALLQAEAAIQRVERWQGFRFPLAERMSAREKFAEAYRIAGRNAWFITMCAIVGALAGAVIRTARGIFSKE